MTMEVPQLPHELLHDIVDYIDLEDKPSFLNLLVSCRTLHAIAEPHFYHDAAFVIAASRNRLHLGKKIQRFYKQISKDNARLAPFVHQFTYISGPPKPMVDDVVIIMEILPLLINLQYFHFSSFDLNISCKSLTKSFCCPKLQTVVWNCSFSKQSYCLEEFVKLHPSIRRLEVLHESQIGLLSFPSLPNLRELVATFDIAWALLPTQHITHLRLLSSRSILTHDPTKNEALSKLTHFHAPPRLSVIQLFELLRHMPDLQCLVYPKPASPLEDLPPLFTLNESHSKLTRLEYFWFDSSYHLSDMPNPTSLFKSVPSLRIFDLTIDRSKLIRYRHDGKSALMSLPTFQGSWPSEDELLRILQTPIQTAVVKPKLPIRVWRLYRRR